MPYRLDTVDIVEQARNRNFLTLGKDYSLMLAVARNVPLQIPPALRKARNVVVKDFYLLNEQKEEVQRIDHSKIANVSLVDNFDQIRNTIPWSSELAEKGSFIHALQGFPESIQVICKVRDNPGSLSETIESILNALHLNKQEIFSYVNSKKSNKLTREELKKLITALVLFEPANEDILAALRMDKSSGALEQQACAELLFVRIPALLEPMCKVNPRIVRQRLFAKIAKLGTSAQQRMALFGYFKSDVTARELAKTLDKIAVIGTKILDAKMSETLCDYISSLKQKIEFEGEVYEHLFLTSELRQMRKLHLPGKVLKTRYTYYERIIKTHTHIDTLSFYPTKCYLDISKYRISSDCTGSGLAEQHLATPNYFCIRIFKSDVWRGNMYMLDFTEEHGVLLVDRIQLPRYLKANYIQFFDHLKEMLTEMFVDVGYDAILLPTSLSNHASIQKTYNKYKKRLRKVYFTPQLAAAEHFESLCRSGSLVVLCEKVTNTTMNEKRLSLPHL